MRKPPYYATPLRKAAEIRNWLKSSINLYASRDFRGGRYAPSWNVRADRFDASGMKFAKEHGLRANLTERWLAHIEDDHQLFNHICEDAGRTYSEGEWTEWPGINQGHYRFGFYGRSGGNLVLEKAFGRSMIFDDEADFADWIDALTYPELRHVYAVFVQLNHDLRRQATQDEVTWHYADARSLWEGEIDDEETATAREIEASRPDMYA